MHRLAALSLAVVLGGTPLTLLAQTAPAVPASDLMLSWRSNGFAPAGYQGRVAAAGGGTILVLAEALVNGSPANLAPYEVRWFVDDNLIQSGFGLQSVTIPVSSFIHPDAITVRVEIVDASFLANAGTLTVPIANPKAVIEAANGTTLRSGSNEFVATPYSFNVTDANDLVYSWTVDGEVPQAGENPRVLDITVNGSMARSLDIGLQVTHPVNQDESASQSLQVSGQQ